MSIIYSNAIISVRSSKMLNVDRIRRMIAAQTATDAAKILFECGYDEKILTTQPDRVDLIIAREREKTVREFAELCTDDNLRNCILARFDYHNAIAIYIDNNATESVYPIGNIDVGVLRAAVQKKNYSPLPDNLAMALVSLDRMNGATATEVEVTLNRVMYTEIFSRITKGAIHDYFRAEVDFLNLRTAAKIKIFGGDYKNLFIDGGLATEEQINNLLSKKAETIKSALIHTNYDRVLDVLLTGIENEDLTIFENTANAYLILLSEERADSLFSVNMLFHWFVKKTEELRIVKKILMEKKFGKSREQLREELKGVLG